MSASHHHPPGHSSHHGHDHHHVHGPSARMDAAFAAGAGVNFAFVVAELLLGVAANSVALVADAAHNLGDVLALLLAWGAAWLTRRPPTANRTYGWGRGSILAALINAAVLLIGVGAIGVEAIRRLLHPEPIATGIVIAVAAAGIVVNGGSALLFRQHRHEDLNIRAQFLHLTGDALVSAAVVAAALLVRLTGIEWLDPIASLLVAAIITIGTWGTLRDSVDLSLDAVPPGVNQQEVSGWLAGLPGVREVHDLHIWGLSTTETALTAHLVCDAGQGDAGRCDAGPGALPPDACSDGPPPDRVSFPSSSAGPGPRNLHAVAAALRERFAIGHATIQIESVLDAEQCGLRSPERI